MTTIARQEKYIHSHDLCLLYDFVKIMEMDDGSVRTTTCLRIINFLERQWKVVAA